MKFSSQDKRNRKKKKRKSQSVIEKEILAIMQKSMKTALDLALDDIMKEWKY